MVDGELPGMATLPVLAARLQFSPATAYRWDRERRLVARECGEAIKGPVEQVLGRREPLPALAEIAAVLNMSPELMWIFISQLWRWDGPPECAMTQR